MDHLDIKVTELKNLDDKVFPMLLYLRGLQDRIRVLKFPDNDELKIQIDAAEYALANLRAITSAMAIGKGVGPPPQRDKK